MIAGFQFAVDEAGFAFDVTDLSAIERSLHEFASLTEEIDQAACKWSQIWAIEGRDGQTLSDLLFGVHEIDRDVRVLVGAKLDRFANWDDLLDVSPPLEVTCDGSPLPIAPSLALCAMARLQGVRLDGISTTLSGRSGRVPIAMPQVARAADIEVLARTSELALYWRRVACEDAYPEDRLAGLAETLFPNCTFADGFFGQFSRMVGSYASLLPTVVHHLSALSDHAPDVWRMRQQNHERSAEMASRAGVDCSPESPQTHKNRAAMSLRRFNFQGREITCEWHTKLEPHRNRIHFAVDGDMVFVGCMSEHLPT